MERAAGATRVDTARPYLDTVAEHFVESKLSGEGMSDELKACMNTDRELWRETPDYYAPSIHVTEGGGIGINVGGHVIVLPLRRWHQLAATTFLYTSQNQTVASGVEGAHEGITADKSVALAESSPSEPPPKFRFCPNGYRSHVCFNGMCSVCGDPAVSEFPTTPPTPTEHGAESVESGKQNKEDK